ncbi:hypothetical protein TEA_027506 [Camellia sinensis var. sinensis]|uniref:Uncharacterized protein n=1 Tax=Camellia sinensis var. sinensis TaxID=542762 RepID=A0A4S4ECG6_CAMSN|nr:hypothetical protein TEA_027506 [Camellia sinensis var. sinensis]
MAYIYCVQAKAKVRMMKQKGSDQTESYWSNLWGKPRDYQNTAKRSQTLLPSQVNDNRIILDKTLTDQVSIWKSSRGLTDKVVLDHDCSGETCTYYQIGDVFVCEKTGQVHVCDDTCREAVLDPTNELLVCTISGHCFDRLLSPAEMEPDTVREISSSLYFWLFVIKHT